MSTLALRELDTITTHLPAEIILSIMAAVCPPPPSTWIHAGGFVKGDSQSTRQYRDYKAALHALATFSRVCLSASRFLEPYLYRWVVLVTGRELAGFAAAVQGRMEIRMRRSDGRLGGGGGLVRYVRGLYCFVELNAEQNILQWYLFEDELVRWRRRMAAREAARIEEKKGRRRRRVALGWNKRDGGETTTATKMMKKGEGKGVEKEEGESEGVDKNAGGGPPAREKSRDGGGGGGGGVGGKKAAPMAGKKILQAGSAKDRRRRRRKAKNNDAASGTLDGLTGEEAHVTVEGQNQMESTINHAANLFALVLETLSKLPNLTDLLSPWHIIQRAAGLIPQNIWGRSRTARIPSNPASFSKVKTLTIRYIELSRRPEALSSRLFWGEHSWQSLTEYAGDNECSLARVMEVFPSLETLDAHSTTEFGPESMAGYRQGVRIPRASSHHISNQMQLDNSNISRGGGNGGGNENTHSENRIRHLRLRSATIRDFHLARFCRASPTLQTVAVRFKDCHEHPGAYLLTNPEDSLDRGLLACKDSLRCLELLSPHSDHYLSKTREMSRNSRLRRLTCLPELRKLEELTIDLQGLFGMLPETESLKARDVELLHTCLPPSLVSLKIFCHWSHESLGFHVRADDDVVILLNAFREYHEAGSLNCHATMGRLTLVVADDRTRIRNRGDWNKIQDHTVSTAREYFDAVGVDLVIETEVNLEDLDM